MSCRGMGLVRIRMRMWMAILRPSMIPLGTARNVLPPVWHWACRGTGSVRSHHRRGALVVAPGISQLARD